MATGLTGAKVLPSTAAAGLAAFWGSRGRSEHLRSGGMRDDAALVFTSHHEAGATLTVRVAAAH